MPSGPIARARLLRRVPEESNDSMTGYGFLVLIPVAIWFHRRARAARQGGVDGT